jgi:radical SAM-linked protein
MAHRQPDGPPPAPAVQRLAIRYAKRGVVRFASARDVGRAFERAIRRAGVPIAYSAGFHPHPRVSYLGAAPTGAASEAEYLELRLAEHRDPDELRRHLDAALPEGLAVLAAADSTDGLGARLPGLLAASEWRLTWSGVEGAALNAAISAFLAAQSQVVERPGRGAKSRARQVEVRPAVASIRLAAAPGGTGVGEEGAQVRDVIVHHGEPTVRPDDVAQAVEAHLPHPPRAPAAM